MRSLATRRSTPGQSSDGGVRHVSREIGVIQAPGGIVITLDVRRWNVRHLVGASVAYWTALAVTTLAPFARIALPLTQGSGNHGTVTASLGSGGFNLSALRDGVTVYTASAPLSLIAFWIAGPPLALWLLWLALRPSRNASAAMHSSPVFDALPDAAPRRMERSRRGVAFRGAGRAPRESRLARRVHRAAHGVAKNAARRQA